MRKRLTVNRLTARAAPNYGTWFILFPFEVGREGAGKWIGSLNTRLYQRAGQTCFILKTEGDPISYRSVCRTFTVRIRYVIIFAQYVCFRLLRRVSCELQSTSLVSLLLTVKFNDTQVHFIVTIYFIPTYRKHECEFFLAGTHSRDVKFRRTKCHSNNYFNRMLYTFIIAERVSVTGYTLVRSKRILD